VTRVVIVGIGPEQTGQSLARQTSVARGRKSREESEPRRPESRHGRSVIGLEAEGTKGQQTQHVDETLSTTGSTVKADDGFGLTPR